MNANQQPHSNNFNKLQAQLRGAVGKAIGDYRMIADGDRVMVCLSGGKDSYTMLDMLLSLQRSAPIHFDILAVNLDQKQPGFPAETLPQYLTDLKVPFRIIEQNTYAVVKRVIPEGKTLCGLCSRLRRGALYRFAAENGMTKIALGHHRDDLIETLFLNMFFGGKLKAMPPKLLSEDRRHIVIRPLAYVPESLIARYASARQFPIIPCSLCGSQDNMQRVAVKQMLREWEQKFPGRAESIFAGLCNVAASQLADPALFDFANLERLRLAGEALEISSLNDLAGAAAPLANSFWIEPGRLLAGEYPGAATPANTQRRLQALIDAGISYFIDLTESGELAPYDHLLPEARTDDGRYVIYVRKPIRDHGVPSSPELMAEILDYVTRALEVGHQVYVHCRGGIGRTNTVTGCWLRRTGLDGAQAILRLNVLWQANARAASWPHIPETQAQEQYVRGWQEPSAALEELLDLPTMAALRNRYLGALLGLGIGDAIGAVAQFRKPGQFAPLTDMQSGGHWQLPIGAWTDDTALTLCVAQSLLAHEGCDCVDQINRYRRWQADAEPSSTAQCIGIGAAVASALSKGAGAESSTRRLSMRTTSVDAQVLERAGAVALFAPALPEQVFDWVEQIVSVTHSQPQVLVAARYYACLMLAILRGATRATLLADARALLLMPALALQGERAVQTKIWSALREYPALTAPADADDVADELRRVLAMLGEASNYREGLLQLVNFGGDADVRGALYGQLAGAWYGAQQLPKSWRAALLQHELLEFTADRLLAAALAPQSDLRPVAPRRDQAPQ